MLELADNVDHGVFVQLFSFSDVPFSFFPNRWFTATDVRKETPVEDYFSSSFLNIQSQQLWPSIPQEAFFGKWFSTWKKWPEMLIFRSLFFFNLFKKIWFGQKANLFRCAFYIIKNARFLSTFYICVSNMWPVKWGGHFELGEYLLLE